MVCFDFLLDIETVPTVWYVLIFILLQLATKYYSFQTVAHTEILEGVLMYKACGSICTQCTYLRSILKKNVVYFIPHVQPEDAPLGQVVS